MEMSQGEKVLVNADKPYFYSTDHPLTVPKERPIQFEFHLVDLH